MARFTREQGERLNRWFWRGKRRELNEIGILRRRLAFIIGLPCEDSLERAEVRYQDLCDKTDYLFRGRWTDDFAPETKKLARATPNELRAFWISLRLLDTQTKDRVGWVENGSLIVPETQPDETKAKT